MYNGQHYIIFISTYRLKAVICAGIGFLGAQNQTLITKHIRVSGVVWINPHPNYNQFVFLYSDL